MKTETTKLAHTPTPWTPHPKTPVYHSGEHRIMISVNDAETPVAIAIGQTLEQAQGNAALIVRAVNSHADMLNAAKELTDFIERSPALKPAFDNQWTHACAYFNNLIQAIAKAEGRA